MAFSIKRTTARAGVQRHGLADREQQGVGARLRELESVPDVGLGFERLDGVVQAAGRPDDRIVPYARLYIWFKPHGS